MVNNAYFSILWPGLLIFLIVSGVFMDFPGILKLKTSGCVLETRQKNSKHIGHPVGFENLCAPGPRNPAQFFAHHFGLRPNEVTEKFHLFWIKFPSCPPYKVTFYPEKMLHILQFKKAATFHSFGKTPFLLDCVETQNLFSAVDFFQTDIKIHRIGNWTPYYAFL